MNLIQVLGCFEIGLIYAFVAIGTFIALKILDFPDLGVDGTFPLGACVCAVLLSLDINPFVATFASIIAGTMAGFMTSWLSTHLKFLNLLSGILVMTALYSINLRIMGKPNLSLMNDNNIFDYFIFFKNTFGIFYKIVPLVLITLLIIFALNKFLKTNIGLQIRATGDNVSMAKAHGINDKHMTIIGICISNALVALSGAIFCQANGYCDISMGLGTIIIGLAAVIIGNGLINNSRMSVMLLACVIGSIAYRLIVALALNIGSDFLSASDLNLVTAVLVAIAMIITKFKKTR